MRGVLSTIAVKGAAVAVILLLAIVYWSGATCVDRIRALEDQGKLSASVADEMVRDVWVCHGLIGGAALVSFVVLGIAAARVERRASETSASLSETTGELQDLSLARTSFLAMMSHELRTPLNSIIGFSGILSSGMAGDLTVEQRKQVGIINSAGKQLLMLINDILDLSKLETGKLVLVAEEFKTAAVIDSVADTLRPLADDRGLELRVRVLDPGLTMCTDRRRLEQILLSMVARSVRITESGHVTVAVESADGSVAFTVSDTSAGMTAEEIAGLFEEQLEVEARPGRSRSTGFALMVSRQLAVALGGDIVVESEPGHGSVFTLAIPEVLGEGACL